MAAMPNLKLISRAGIGLDGADLLVAQGSGLRFIIPQRSETSSS